MDLAEEDQLKAAEKLESEKLAKINFNPTRIVDFDALLCDTYDKQCPKPVHYDNRRDLIRIFNMMAKEIYGNSKSSPVVEEYGSFVMDIFNEKSDLDLSINFSKDSIEISRQKKIDTLRRFSKKLRLIQRNGHVTALEVILSAKVPIIKVTDSGTGIECDLSVENRDGIAKSHIIRAISAIDERFQKLSLLMKAWAKAHNINSSKDATLNSLSIVSFVAFHLQTCNPPILPPFSTLFKDGADLESVTKIVKAHTNYGNENKESLAKLFITLLVKLGSVENLWQNGYCTSSYKGSWVLKSWKYSMSIEDFTDPSQNVARAVRAEGFEAIYGCIHNSIDYVSQFLNGEIQGIELMDHLFGKPIVSSPGVEGTSTSNINTRKNNRPILQNPSPTKKKKRSLFTPPLPYQPQYQSPSATYSSNFKEHHSYVPRNVPPPPPFGLNPAIFQGSYIPSVQSHRVSSQIYRDFVPTFHQNAVASNPYHGLFPHSSLQGRDYASPQRDYAHRRDASPQRRDYASPQTWDYAHRRDYGSLHRRDHASPQRDHALDNHRSG